jgi:hypothetical protein
MFLRCRSDLAAAAVHGNDGERTEVVKMTFPIAMVLALLLATVFPSFAGAQAVVGTLPPELAALDAPDPRQSVALGAGKAGIVGEWTNIAAHSGPLGENARGQFHSKVTSGPLSGFEIRGEVTCLTVVGNQAGIGGIITELVNNPTQIPDPHGFIYTVEDNGNQQVLPDRVGTILLLSNPPLGCPPGSTAIPLSEGNFVVRGALP